MRVPANAMNRNESISIDTLIQSGGWYAGLHTAVCTGFYIELRPNLGCLYLFEDWGDEPFYGYLDSVIFCQGTRDANIASVRRVVRVPDAPNMVRELNRSRLSIKDFEFRIVAIRGSHNNYNDPSRFQSLPEWVWDQENPK